MEIRFHFFFENNIDVEFLEDPMLNTIGCYMVTILVIYHLEMGTNLRKTLPLNLDLRV